MQTLCLSFSPRPLSLYPARRPHLSLHSTFISFRISSNFDKRMSFCNNRRGFGPVCYASSIPPHNLHWVSAVSTAILMLVKGTAINKTFLVPLFALQAPSSIISWIKGEYGIWTAFLALLVRLFFFIPGELELPFVALLLVILAPYQAINLRGKPEGIVLSLLIAGYLAFQHFSRAGSLKKAFDQDSVVATVAIVCIFAVPCLLLF